MPATDSSTFRRPSDRSLPNLPSSLDGVLLYVALRRLRLIKWALTGTLVLREPPREDCERFVQAEFHRIRDMLHTEVAAGLEFHVAAALCNAVFDGLFEASFEGPLHRLASWCEMKQRRRARDELSKVTVSD